MYRILLSTALIGVNNRLSPSCFLPPATDQKKGGFIIKRFDRQHRVPRLRIGRTVAGGMRTFSGLLADAPVAGCGDDVFVRINPFLVAGDAAFGVAQARVE